MTCAQGLLRLLWGGARSWSATGLRPPATKNFRSRFTVVGMASLETLRQRDQRDINIARNVVKINLLVCH